MVQWLAGLTCNISMPVKLEFEPYHRDSRCFIDIETQPSLLSTGWFQERIRV